MCGIAGLFALSPAAGQPSAAELTAMIGRLRHRGPDGQTIALAGRAGLAHARLSLLDLAGGAQPFQTPDGQIQVVCNGEIFNHAALRIWLQSRGVRLKTRCDIEVLPHLYAALGDAFLERLDGQFALAVWDARRQRLLLARDRFGIRPLFHTRHRGRLAFASEIKALAALPGLSLALDPVGLGMVMTTWGTLAPNTVFTGIESLGPGACLVADEHGIRYRNWWTWRPGHDADGAPADGHALTLDDEAALAVQLRERLAAAVERQMQADVPVAIALSGGVDSAAIAALASQVARRNGWPAPASFGLAFDDAEFDESPWQRRLAASLGTRHTTVHCSDNDIADGFERTVWHAETPLVRTAPVPMLRLAEAIRAAGFRAILTGEAADELFAGYDLFKEARIRRFVRSDADPAGRGRLLDRLYPYLANNPAAAGQLGRLSFLNDLSAPTAVDFAHRTRIAASRRTMALLTPDWQRAVAARDPRQALASRLPADIAAWPALARDQAVEALSLLSAHLLSTQGDRPAMAASIETRLPFLDTAVVELASQLPDRLKLRGLRDKRLLRAALRADLPAWMATRPKQPYRAPEARCFFVNGRLRPWVAERLCARELRHTGVFDPERVGQLTAKLSAGKAVSFAESMALTVVLSTQLLARQFLNRSNTGNQP